MKFTVDRLALVKVLNLAQKKAPGVKRRDKLVRLTASAARVFIEANHCAASVEALVVTEGACSAQHDLFLKLLQSYAPKTHLLIEVNEGSLRMGTTTLSVTDFSTKTTVPWSYTTFEPATLAQQLFRSQDPI